MPEDQLGGVVEVPDQGGLGTRLSQYCVGRILASELGFALRSAEVPGFPQAGALSAAAPTPDDDEEAGETTDHGEGDGEDEDAGARDDDDAGTVTLTGHRLDLPALRSDPGAQRLVVRGLFCRYDIYRPHKQAIRTNWLAGPSLERAGPEDLTIHVRAGNIWQSSARGPVRPDHPALPFSFYADIVRSREWRKIRVVSEDPADPMVKKLVSSFAAEVRLGTPLEDFRTLQASANLVLSVSTFAWWAGWLSRAERIYFPVAGLFDRERSEGRPAPWQHDLWVDDEPRYQAVVPAGLIADWQGTEADRHRLLNAEPTGPGAPPRPQPAPAARSGPPADQRGTLAMIEGFWKPKDNQAHGTYQAAYLTCQALAEQDRYTALHLYRDGQRRPTVASDLVLPDTPPTTVFDKLLLHGTRERYAAIHVANGEQILSAPHLLRPRNDWAPVICSVGTTHATGQWSNLLLSIASGAVRPSDGFIFKSRAAEAIFRRTFEAWSDRFGFPGPLLGETTVIPNGVDVEANQRSAPLREETRRRLRIGERDLVFLTFSRLSPGTKGDFQALVVRWKEVTERLPQALLLLSGAVVERSFVADLRLLARAAGVGDRVIVLDNPFEVAANARTRLMSAADVFVHLSTGVEEASPLVVPEAMAHGLPIIATAWAGVPEVVSAGESGFLLETRQAPVAPYIAATMFGHSDRTHLLYASKVVTTDWAAFVGAAQALGYEERRRRMGQAARRRAEAHAAPRIARRYVEFFDSTARAAERAWTGPAATRPIVDLDGIIAAQASRPLALEDKVRLGDATRARLLALGLHPEPAARLEQVVAAFQGREHLTVAELAGVAARPGGGPPADGTGQDDLAATSRFLVRLLNFGVVELA